MEYIDINTYLSCGDVPTPPKTRHVTSIKNPSQLIVPFSYELVIEGYERKFLDTKTDLLVVHGICGRREAGERRQK